MQVRIAGVNLPNKKIDIALSYIYGIGRPLGVKILNDLKIDRNKKAEELTADEVKILKDTIEKSSKVEGELRREIMMNIKRLRDISCYRGVRHIRGLPVRGQKTKTNSRTVRGNVRKTVGSGRRKLEKT